MPRPAVVDRPPLHKAAPIFQQLRRARIDQGISQERLGLELGTKQNVISEWELGKKVPGMVNLISWARVLGLEIVAQPRNPEK